MNPTLLETTLQFLALPVRLETAIVVAASFTLSWATD